MGAVCGMTLVRKRSNPERNNPTNPPDWSALMPVLPGEGPRIRELYAAIRRLIETGMAAPGAKLPTTRDLAQRLGMARGAAVAAFEMLIAEGFAEAKVGAGTFIAPQVPYVPAKAAHTTGHRAHEGRPAAALPCDLGVGLPDARTLRIFRNLLSRHLARPGPEHFGYHDPRGGQALRDAIAAYLKAARGVHCDAGRIIVTSGTQQGLDLVARATLNSGDRIWVEDPCFPMARAAFAGTGADLVGIPVDDEGLDAAQGETLCPRARAAYVTPSHQFPLGVTMTMRRRLALLDWAQRNDAWILEDDYDSEFRYAGPPLTALQGVDGAERVIYFGTFSKVLFPGLRTGYAVLPPALFDAVLSLRVRSDRQPPTLVEGALAALLNEGHFAAHLRRARRRMQACRDSLVAGLLAHSEGFLDVAVPEQGLHLVAKFHRNLERKDTEIVAAARAAGVGARALSSMFVAAKPQQGLVLGFSGFPEEDLRAAAEKIGDIVRR
jgi:GntR family transcriptional regulator / MocR family aminotransferase